jgi:hypothetical protein
VRLAALALAATLSTTDPFPLPLPPELIVINDADAAAVQVQPVPAVTAMVDVPALAARLRDVGDTANVQVVVVVPPGVVLGVTGVELLEHATAVRAAASNPHRRGSVTDEITPQNISMQVDGVKGVARGVHFHVGTCRGGVSWLSFI